MRIISLLLAITMILTGGTSCSVNVMEGFADLNTNEARLFDAKQLINAGDYDAALTKIGEMDSVFQAREEVVRLKASAYAGKCGLNFTDLVDSLENMGTTNFFIALMNAFPGGTVAKAGHCLTAENLIEGLGATPATRSEDDNVFLALISFAKIGNYFNFYVDATDDGAVDNVNVCSGGPIPDADIREIGASINMALFSIQASGVNIGSTSLTAMTALCPGGSFCDAAAPIYNPATFSAANLLEIRTMMHEGPAATSSVGLYSCAQAADATGCGMPCN